MKILFITSNRLGDAILSTGILDALGQRNAQAEFTIACGAIPAPIFKEWPGLQEIIILKRKPFLGHWFSLWKEIASHPWDIIVDVRGSVISYCVKAKQRFIWRSTATLNHRVEQLAAMAGVKPVPYPKVYFAKKRIQQLETYFHDSRPVIALAPTANWRGKEWPHEYFLKLIRDITGERGILPKACVAVFSAPEERLRIKDFLTQIPSEQLIDCAGNLELLDIAAFFSQCRLFIGNDSGLMHLAAATGIPTFGLFGPSPDQYYAPYGRKTGYVRTPESYETLKKRQQTGDQGSLMTNLAVESVVGALEQFWGRVSG
ncbi:hypothetical protein IM40_00870 [Candidatus Paracaedimonas acanthamoebae]|nr:hypothetical protein IM40_00870 [Candidatus Paracaedimonas acanthamoebae]